MYVIKTERELVVRKYQEYHLRSTTLAALFILLYSLLKVALEHLSGI